MKPAALKPSVLMLSPEPPYPLRGGGAYRTASLVHYFSRFAEVDLIQISESGQPALLPPGLVRAQKVIALPRHGKAPVSRYLRNARRALRGVSPLIDRLSGLGKAIGEAIGSARYDIGIIEHFWCAPYVEQLATVCDITVLDLHNIESVLHERCATVERGLIAMGHRRFASASRKLESELLPQFSLVLATSASDSERALALAPLAHIKVYPNALPWVDLPQERGHIGNLLHRAVVFSANFEYHPNIDAVRFLVSEVWPEVKKRQPGLRLKLVGRGDRFIRHLIPAGMDVEVTGEVGDAFREIAEAAIVIAPLRTGSGTRIKILEGWAAGRPIVATPLAAEGLRVKDGGNMVLATDGAGFASAIGLLLSEPDKAQQIGLGGRHTFERHYTWEAAWGILDANLQVTRITELNRYTG
jgi:glycosyltransferase involved in cell wall biosynthesis